MRLDSLYMELDPSFFLYHHACSSSIESSHSTKSVKSMTQINTRQNTKINFEVIHNKLQIIIQMYW